MINITTKVYYRHGVDQEIDTRVRPIKKAAKAKTTETPKRCKQVMVGELYKGTDLATAVARAELDGEELKGMGLGGLIAEEGERVLPETNFRTDRHEMRERMKMSGHEREYKIAEHKKNVAAKDAEAKNAPTAE